MPATSATITVHTRAVERYYEELGLTSTRSAPTPAAPSPPIPTVPTTPNTSCA